MADALKNFLVGKTIVKVVSYIDRNNGIYSKKYPLSITGVSALGKRPIFHLSRVPGSNPPRDDREGRKAIVAFLGMTGRWLLEPAGHTRAKIKMLDDQEKVSYLYFDDKRKLGKLDFLKGRYEYQKYFSKAGVDLISEGLDWDQFAAIVARPRAQKMELCRFLMETTYFSSIGNYLKSEIIYYTGHHPQKLMSSFKKRELKILHRAMVKITQKAYQKGGFTIEDYLLPDGTYGGYSSMCYGHEKDFYGRPVLKDTFSDKRTTHYVIQ